jgi:DNA-binding response OmpR family regulator
VDVDDPADALARLAAGFVPRLLVTDIVLPGMRGSDLAAAVRQRLGAVAVLFISGFAPEAIAHHNPEAPAEHFLGKPFSGEELLLRVRAVLDDVPTS